MTTFRPEQKSNATVGPLITLYRGYLEETKSEVSAAILAIDAYYRSLRLATVPTTVDKRTEQARTVVTPPQVAQQLGVNPATIIGWIRSGQLTAANVGKGAQRPRYRICPSDLELFLKKRQPALRNAIDSRRRPMDGAIEFF